jgi:hypothetical protein
MSTEQCVLVRNTTSEHGQWISYPHLSECTGTFFTLLYTVVPPYPRVIRSKTYCGCPKPRIVANHIQVNFRLTKVDAGKLKCKYLNRPWSNLAVNVLIFSVRSKQRITETVDTGVLLYCLSITTTTFVPYDYSFVTYVHLYKNGTKYEELSPCLIILHQHMDFHEIWYVRHATSGQATFA